MFRITQEFCFLSSEKVAFRVMTRQKFLKELVENAAKLQSAVQVSAVQASAVQILVVVAPIL